jgi:hypothetical protein
MAQLYLHPHEQSITDAGAALIAYISARWSQMVPGSFSSDRCRVSRRQPSWPSETPTPFLLRVRTAE